MAGVSRLQYANDIRMVRVMCSGRVDLEFILRAFSNGQDGVFIGGCRLNECNYVTQGNYDALGNVFLAKNIMQRVGLDPERLRIEFMSAADGILLAEVINEFSAKIKALGPLGSEDGAEGPNRRLKLEAAIKIVPYIKLVERERLRVPFKSEQAYHDFFTGRDFKALFDQLIGEKLTASQIMLLLSEKPRSPQALAEFLGLRPAEVSRLLNFSTRQGWVRYDERLGCYAPA